MTRGYGRRIDKRVSHRSREAWRRHLEGPKHNHPHNKVIMELMDSTDKIAALQGFESIHKDLHEEIKRRRRAEATAALLASQMGES